jgi:hypothetical protein
VRRSNPRLHCVIDGTRLNAGGQKGILFAVSAARFSGVGTGQPWTHIDPEALRGGARLESAVPMTQDEERELRQQLARVQQEHRDLDAAISALQHSPGSDLLQVQRLKKRKLYLRDRISHIEDQLTPDIIA